MATLPVKTKKESKENYYSSKKIVSKDMFAEFISVIQFPKFS